MVGLVPLSNHLLHLLSGNVAHVSISHILSHSSLGIFGSQTNPLPLLTSQIMAPILTRNFVKHQAPSTTLELPGGFLLPLELI